MQKNELVDRLRKMESAVDVYNLKPEIIRHLEGKQDSDKKKKEKDTNG